MKDNKEREPVPLGPQAIHDTVIRLMTTNRSLRVLDVPAGEGALAKSLLALGHDVVCADLYTEIFRLDGTPIVRADLDARLPFEAEEFDALVCLEGLEHIDNPSNAISEFRRVLKPGGKLIISVPNILNIEERLKWLISGYTSHFKPLSAPALDAIGDEYGGMEEIALHVNPIGYSEVRYLLEKNAFELECVHRDKKKGRSWLFLPLVWSIRLVGRFTSAARQEKNWTAELNSDPVLYGGNTIIFEANLKDGAVQK